MIKFLLKLIPKNLKPIIVGVPVIIQNDKKEILLGKRNSFVFYPNTWGLPGGLTIQNEKLIDAGIREVKEELGINIKILKQSKNIYEILPNKKSSIHSIAIPFYGKIISGIPKALNETKEVKWFKPSEIRKMNLAYNHEEILKKEKLI